MSGQRCAQIRANGQRCGGFAVTGSAYCFAHDPAQAAKRDDARHRGGEAGRIEPLGEWYSHRFHKRTGLDERAAMRGLRLDR